MEVDIDLQRGCPPIWRSALFASALHLFAGDDELGVENGQRRGARSFTNAHHWLEAARRITGSECCVTLYIEISREFLLSARKELDLLRQLIH